MPVKLYMDVHIPKSIVVNLQTRNVDIITAQEDGAARYNDDKLILRAGKLGRVLFSFDIDMVIEAVRFQKEKIDFSGVIYAHPLKNTIGKCIELLELYAKIAELKDFKNMVEFL